MSLTLTDFVQPLTFYFMFVNQSHWFVSLLSLYRYIFFLSNFSLQSFKSFKGGILALEFKTGENKLVWF